MTSPMGRDSAPTSSGNGAPIDSGQLQQAASGLIDQAARTADAQASTRMTMAGDTLDGIAQAIDDAAERLREQQPELANLTSTAADRLQGAAAYLRDHNASEALQGIQEYARQQPAMVIGGGLLAGIMLGRFLRTGASIAQGETGRRGLSGRSGSGYDATAATSYDDSTGPTSSGDAYGSTYGTDTSQELLVTDAAALSGSDAGTDALDSDLAIAEVDVDAVDDLGRATDETTIGEGR